MSDMSDRTREWAREYLTGTALTGVLAALDHIPGHRVPRVCLDSQSPWASVEALPEPKLVVWLVNGDVYEVDDNGAVGETPIETIEEVNKS